MKTFIKGLFLTFILITSYPVKADELRFAVIPKGENPFFLESKKGCEDAATEIGGVKCIFRGPKEDDFRLQNQILEKFVDDGVDGIAIAIIKTEYMVRNGLQKAKKKGIPVITFDSDFDSSTLDKYENLRLAYIGSDNLAFGKALGEQVKKLRPNGGKLCIQSAHKGESNLILRMMGVRSALSGKTYTSPPGKKLKNVNGWTEISRCPLYGNGQSVPSIEQMKFILRKAPKEVDTFVAVGGWVQMNNIKKYREMIPLFKEKMDRREIAVVIGDTTEGQLECLKDHLSHINVGQRPYDMGRQAIFTLYNIVKKNGYKKVIYTPLTYCTPENYDTCTKSSN